MTWTDAGAIGEILGAIAVVLSLVYLSRQVRQNTQAVRTGNAALVQGNFQQLAGFRRYRAERESAFVPEFREAMEDWLATPGELERTDVMLGADVPTRAGPSLRSDPAWSPPRRYTGLRHPRS
jgi:hypothetical protein